MKNGNKGTGSKTTEIRLAIFSVLVAMFGAGQTRAQVVTFTTTGDSVATSQAASKAATQKSTGVSGTPSLTRSSDLGAGNGAADSFFSAVSTTSNFTNTFDPTKTYTGFSVVPSSGSVLFATSISFTSRGSGTAPDSYAIAYSTDGFATNINQQFTGTTVTTNVLRSSDITDLITNDTLSVRFSNFGAKSIGSSSAPASGGSFRTIDPTVAGTTLTAASSAIALAANTEVRNSATALTLGGVISGGFSLTKTGVGALSLSNANTYTGGTTVSAGTLLVNNTVSGTNSGTGTGAVAVNNSGTVLGGTGSIAGAVTIGSGATITGATNGTVGSLTLQSTATFTGVSGSLATYAVDISGTTSDSLAITGNLNLSNGFDQITFTGTPDGTSSYVLATYSAVTGTFDNFVYPSGYTLDYGATALTLTPVPEPATILGGIFLVAGAGWTQRRRLRWLVKGNA